MYLQSSEALFTNISSQLFVHLFTPSKHEFEEKIHWKSKIKLKPIHKNGFQEDDDHIPVYFNKKKVLCLRVVYVTYFSIKCNSNKLHKTCLSVSCRAITQ